MGELPGLAAKVRLTEAGKQVPIGNGGVGPNYWWNQSLSEASVYFDVAPGTPSKSVRWTVTPTTVRLALLGHSEPLLEGELGGKVAPGDSLWEIEVRDWVEPTKGVWVWVVWLVLSSLLLLGLLRVQRSG